MNFLPYVAIIVLVIFSAFFSGSEIAYTSANKMRLQKLAENGKKSAALAYKIYCDFDKMLTTILIGNNFVNIAASAVATVIALNIFKDAEELGTLISTLIMTVIILIFGEIVPKVVAKKISETVSCIAAYPLRVFMIIMFPLVWIISGFVKLISRAYKKKDDTPSITEDELATIIETVEEEGVIDEEKSDLLQSALEFYDISLSEILTPRKDMVTIDIDDDMDDIMETVTQSHFSRIPVYEDGIDNIIGILYLNHFFKEIVDNKQNINIRKLLMEPCFFHKTMKLPAVLSEMRRRQVHLAVVIDEYGGTLGIVTMEDILEQIVGDIWDESDEIKNEFVRLEDGSAEVSGDMGIYDFFDELDIDSDDFESEYTTVGGWCIEMLDGQPHEGDSFEYLNLYIIIAEMKDMRVTKVTVIVREPEPDEEE